MKPLNKIVTLIFAVTFANILPAQTVIKGKVSDIQGNPLPGTSIYLENTYDGTSSDAQGNFELSTNETGTQILKAEFLGFEAFSQPVNLQGTLLNINITLKEKFNELDAVTVTAGTFSAGDKKKTITLSSLDMVTTASATGDIYGAMRSLPGTTTVGESGKLFVKGGDSRESNTYINGTLVYEPFSSSVPNSPVRGRFNPFMFSGTMFSTGGYSAEYGQALSSVLALNTNDMPLEDALDISVLSVGADVAGTKTWDKASITASAKYNNLKPYMSLVPQQLNWSKEPVSMGADASLWFKTPKAGLFKMYSNLSQASMEILQDELSDQNITNQYNLTNDNFFTNASWTGSIADKWVLSSGFSLTQNTNRVKTNAYDYTEKLLGTHTKEVLSHQLTDKILLKTGMEWYARNYGIAYSTDSSVANPDFTNHTLAAFAEANIYTSTRFVVNLGTRAEYSSLLKKSSLAPRLSSAYKINDQSQLSASFGLFIQDPDNEYLLYSNQMDFEQATHYTLDYITKIKKRELRTELFYKNYNKLVKTTTDPTVYTNNGTGYARGFDFFWRDKTTFKYGEYWISYSFIDTKRNYRDYPVEAIPSYTSKHNLNFVYKYWINGLRSLVGGSYKFASPRVYNNPNSLVFNNEQTIPYQSLDLNWSFLYTQNIIFYASVSNVLGFKQEFGKTYSDIPNDQGIYESKTVVPGSKRFFVVACFITLTKKGDQNQLDKIE